MKKVISFAFISFVFSLSTFSYGAAFQALELVTHTDPSSGTAKEVNIMQVFEKTNGYFYLVFYKGKAFEVEEKDLKKIEPKPQAVQEKRKLRATGAEEPREGIIGELPENPFERDEEGKFIHSEEVREAVTRAFLGGFRGREACKCQPNRAGF